MRFVPVFLQNALQSCESSMASQASARRREWNLRTPQLVRRRLRRDSPMML